MEKVDIRMGIFLHGIEKRTSRRKCVFSVDDLASRQYQFFHSPFANGLLESVEEVAVLKLYSCLYAFGDMLFPAHLSG
jgi:hypothetical protein